MTQSHGNQPGTLPPDEANSGESQDTEPISDQHRYMSDAAYKHAMALSDLGDTDDEDPHNATPVNGNLDHDDPDTPPSIQGEESLSGSDPISGRDYDIDELNDQVGLATDDMNNPQPLDIASKLDEAEEYQRTH
jgi:hypothetical protein